MRIFAKIAAIAALTAGGVVLLNKLVNSAYASIAEKYVTFDDEENALHCGARNESWEN